MSVAEIVLGALLLLLAIAGGLNWRAQLHWHKHYEDRLPRAGVTKSPVILRDTPKKHRAEQ